MHRPSARALAALAALAAPALVAGACAADDDGDGLEDAQVVAEATDDDATDEDPPEPGDADAGDTDHDGEGRGEDAPGGVTLEDPRATDGVWQIGDAGTLSFRVDGDDLELVDAAPAPGWEVSVEEEKRRTIEVVYRTEGRRYEVEVERKGRDLEIDVELDIERAEPGSFPLGGAGVVDLGVDGDEIVLVGLHPTDGWTVAKEDVDDDEVEIELRRDDIRWRLDAKVDDGRLTVAVDLRVTGRHPA